MLSNNEIHVTVMANTTLLIQTVDEIHTPVDGILHCRPEEPTSMPFQLTPTSDHLNPHGDEDNRQQW